ncbi:AraC family transcriptional regulator [Fibrisoma montanum]|uniref:AraC family transcriptional regulator n=1 Tax=Fibrisoma montanum TaxID=2305895 RepID=A0A418M8A3_9BACT|nr:GyrI-like domain-containing protein [Fibrisoma montanum]RIV22324.1 AraC family transcriptional regulator [Fibrisoma montanum]
MTTQQQIAEDALLVKEVQPFTGLCFTTRATLPQLSRYYKTVAEDLYTEAARLSLDINGPVQWIYTGVNGDPANEFQLEIVLPIRQAGAEPTGFTYRTFEPFRCLSYTHTGNWNELMGVYDALFPALHGMGYQNDGRVREVYVVIDFENPANNVTELQIHLA